MDGSSNRISRLDLEYSIQEMESRLQDLKNEITSAVLKSYETQAESWLKYNTEALNLVAAEENNRIQEKSYELGLNQFKDVVDARVDVISARINLSYARYRYIYDRANLDFGLGLKPWKEI